MGNLIGSTSDSSNNQIDPNSGVFQYFYPPKNNEPYFSDHFIMGGEKFETIQPESYLFGENLDLNFLGQVPESFPYSPPLPNQPIKTLHALINVRRESVRFVKANKSNESSDPDVTTMDHHTIDIPDKPITLAEGGDSGTVITDAPGTIDAESSIAVSGSSAVTSTILSKVKRVHSQAFAKKSIKTESDSAACTMTMSNTPSTNYHVEFVFDSDVRCAITIYYFCMEEMTANGVNYISKNEKLNSSTHVYERGSNQLFAQPAHIFNPALINDSELVYRFYDDEGNFNAGNPYPMVIQCVALEGDSPRQSNALIASIEKNSDLSYSLKPLKQKIFIDGLCYIMQEIFGIEKKSLSLSSGVTASAQEKTISGSNTTAFLNPDEDLEDDGSECVICMSESRDTLILPCKHLCLCNVCADSLRYQASSCPICRSPFRALLLIKAARKSIGHPLSNSSNVIIGPQSNHKEVSLANQVDAQTNSKLTHLIDINDAPPGYEPISLIEALNGPSPVNCTRTLELIARNRQAAKKKNSTSSSKSATADLPTEAGTVGSSSRRSSVRSNRISMDGRLERSTGSILSKKINLGSSMRSFGSREMNESDLVGATDAGQQHNFNTYGVWREHAVSNRTESNDSTVSSSASGAQETARLLNAAAEGNKRSQHLHITLDRSMQDISERDSSAHISGRSHDDNGSPLNISLLSIDLAAEDGYDQNGSREMPKLVNLNLNSSQPHVIDLQANAKETKLD